MSRLRLFLVMLATSCSALGLIAQEAPPPQAPPTQEPESQPKGHPEKGPESTPPRGGHRGRGGRGGGEAGWIQVPGTTTRFRFKGGIKLDVACELMGGSRGSFKESGIFQSAPNIALEGTPTSTPQLGLDAKGSFGGVSTETQTDIGIIRCELGLGGGDGPGRGSAQLDDWILIGRTGSLFSSNAGPSSMIGDCGNTGGGSSPQIRLMHPFDKGKFSISIEDMPKCSSLSGPQWNSFCSVGRLDLRPSFGDFSFRGMVRKYRTASANTLGYGGAIGANFNIGEDRLAIDVSGGVGMGSFIGGTMGANPQDAVQYQSSIGLWKAYGASIGYTHEWSRKVKSTLYGGGVVIMDDESIRAIVNKHAASAGPKQEGAPSDRNDYYGRAGGKGGGKHAGGGAPKTYDYYNHMFYALGVNTKWEINRTVSLGVEANYNYRQTFADERGKAKFGKQFQVGLSLNIKVF